MAVKMLLMICIVITMTGCTFNFELTSQRTALENQVMGSYKELDDDLILMSAARGSKTARVTLPEHRRKGVDARKNQQFNQDDIDELKDAQIIGEGNDGYLRLLPKGVGKAGESDRSRTEFAENLMKEENGDREVVWKTIIESNPNLSEKDLPDIRKTFAKTQRDAASAGQWIQGDDGGWTQK